MAGRVVPNYARDHETQSQLEDRRQRKDSSGQSRRRHQMHDLRSHLFRDEAKAQLPGVWNSEYRNTEKEYMYVKLTRVISSKNSKVFHNYRHYCSTQVCVVLFQVVCNKCSNHKLLFQDNKNMRVCRLCHAALTQPLAKSPSSPSAAGPVPSLLQVSASAPSVLSGYLSLKTQAGKPWTRRWFALHVDFVLYSFKTEVESTAMTATPMPGFTVTEGTRLPDEDPLNTRDRIRAFKIYHSRKCYYLQASSQQNKQKCVTATE